MCRRVRVPCVSFGSLFDPIDHGTRTQVGHHGQVPLTRMTAHIHPNIDIVDFVLDWRHGVMVPGSGLHVVPHVSIPINDCWKIVGGNRARNTCIRRYARIT